MQTDHLTDKIRLLRQTATVAETYLQYGLADVAESRLQTLADTILSRGGMNTSNEQV